MAAFYRVALIAILAFPFQKVVADSRTNFKVTRFEECRATTSIKFVGNVSTEKDGRQYLTYDVRTPVPFDENVGDICVIESMLSNKTVIHLFTIREKNFCTATNKYLGEFWYDIIRATQLPPGVCPIPAGRHHAHHVYLNFKAIRLQTFPFGKLRFTWSAIDNRKPENVLLCLIIEVVNIPN